MDFFRELDFLRGTLAPFFLASDSPIAMACLRLFTVPPWPDFPRLRVPFLRRCMALFTDLLALLLYRRRDDRLEELFFVAMKPSIQVAA
ncbi:MAG TPA: hypothetical protein VM684_14735, partial [Gaiellales bacterium]|nr:hypothetical protein [Gaiellales bacterium]